MAASPHVFQGSDGGACGWRDVGEEVDERIQLDDGSRSRPGDIAVGGTGLRPRPVGVPFRSAPARFELPVVPWEDAALGAVQVGDVRLELADYAFGGLGGRVRVPLSGSGAVAATLGPGFRRSGRRRRASRSSGWPRRAGTHPHQRWAAPPPGPGSQPTRPSSLTSAGRRAPASGSAAGRSCARRRAAGPAGGAGGCPSGAGQAVDRVHADDLAPGGGRSPSSGRRRRPAGPRRARGPRARGGRARGGRGRPPGVGDPCRRRRARATGPIGAPAAGRACGVRAVGCGAGRPRP